MGQQGKINGHSKKLNMDEHALKTDLASDMQILLCCFTDVQRFRLLTLKRKEEHNHGFYVLCYFAHYLLLPMIIRREMKLSNHVTIHRKLN